MLSSFRSYLKPFIFAVAKPFAMLGIDPDVFSFFGIIFALIAAYFIYLQDFFPAFIFALLAISIDLFDGALAKLQNRETLFGNYFETIVDKIVEIILFIACALLHPLASVCALGLSMLASYAKPRVALVIITDNRDWPAIGEHSERMLLLIAGLFLSIFSVSIMQFRVLEIFLWLIAIISFAGFLQRVLFAKKLIEESEKNGNIMPYLKKKNLIK